MNQKDSAMYALDTKLINSKDENYVKQFTSVAESFDQEQESDLRYPIVILMARIVERVKMLTSRIH